MKETWSVIAAVTLTAGTLVGCESGAAETATAAPGAATTTAADAGATTAAENKAGLIPIVVEVSPAPHAEILKAAKEILTEQGYGLQIKGYTDYVQPNLALDTEDLNANYSQHYPYLKQFNQERGIRISSTAAIHYEPFGIYAGKTASLGALADDAKIAVPDDATNKARALLLLEVQGLVKLREGAGLNVTKNGVVENVRKLDIFEVEAAQIPRSLQDMDIAVINGNYAIEADLKVSDALAIEDMTSTTATTYGNTVAVQGGHEKDDAILALVDTLTSDAVRKFIKGKYTGAAVPLF